jgi:hypothetical protein
MNEKSVTERFFNRFKKVRSNLQSYEVKRNTDLLLMEQKAKNDLFISGLNFYGTFLGINASKGGELR